MNFYKWSRNQKEKIPVTYGVGIAKLKKQKESKFSIKSLFL